MLHADLGSESVWGQVVYRRSAVLPKGKYVREGNAKGKCGKGSVGGSK